MRSCCNTASLCLPLAVWWTPYTSMQMQDPLALLARQEGAIEGQQCHSLHLLHAEAQLLGPDRPLVVQVDGHDARVVGVDAQRDACGQNG